MVVSDKDCCGFFKYAYERGSQLGRSLKEGAV
jgi:hypothetical protein